MNSLERIRFITVNYSRLQGLKAVPIGLLLLLTILWANAQTGRARDLTVPIIYLIAGIVVYAAIDRYYHRNFGQADPRRGFLWADIILSVVFSVLAMGAFWLDMIIQGPVSIFTLVFAIGLFLDYVVMVRRSAIKSLMVFPTALTLCILIALSGLLPILGKEAWQSVGFRSPLFAVYGIIGVWIVLYGVGSHLLLARWMLNPREVRNEQSI